MTERDRSRQPELTPAQLAAVASLLNGATDGEAAEAAGVSRQTVWTWRHKHPGFIVELNRRREELFAGARDRLRSMLPKALDVLEEELEGGERRYQAALQLLKLSGLGDGAGAVGETDPKKLLDGMARERRPVPHEFLDAALGGGPVTDEERDRVLAEAESEAGQ